MLPGGVCGFWPRKLRPKTTDELLGIAREHQRPAVNAVNENQAGLGGLGLLVTEPEKNRDKE